MNTKSNTFTSPSGDAETFHAAKLPADPSIIHGSGFGGEAAWEEILVHNILGGMLASIREFLPHGFTTARVEMDSIKNTADFIAYNERFGHHYASTAAGAVAKLYQSTGCLNYHDALIKKANDLKQQAANLEAEAACL